MPTQTLAPAADARSAAIEPIELIELELPEVEAEPLAPRDVSVRAGDPTRRACRPMPAALGPFIDSETGRLEEPQCRCGRR